MDEALMQVNLCPSNNIGKASCSVLCNGDEILKAESEAIVNISHSIASVYPVNGVITVITDPPPDEPALVLHDDSPLLPSDLNHRSFGLENIHNRRKNRLWSKDSMAKAINAVRNGMHVRAAAKQFSVPRTTLKSKLGSNSFKIKKTEDNTPQSISFNDSQTRCSSNIDKLAYFRENSTIQPYKDQFSPPIVVSKSSTSTPVTTHQDIIKIPLIDKCHTLQNDGELLKTISSIKLGKRNKMWSEETMKQAVDAVMKGSKIKDASILYGVPHSTLGNRVLVNRHKLDKTVKRSKSQTEVDITNLYPPILPAPAPKPRNIIQKQITLQSTSTALTSETHGQNKPVTKRRGKIKQWTEESMIKALEALENEGLSINAAAKKYNVPKSTLDVKRRRGDFIRPGFVGPDIIGSLQDEYPLVCYVNVCAMFGFTNIKNVVLLLAAESAERQGLWNIKEQGLLPDSWWEAFCHRRANLIKNVDVKTRQLVRLTKARVSLFFDKLSTVINGSNFHKVPLHCLDERTFTVQEMKFDMKTVNSWLNDGSSTTTIPSCLPHDKNNDCESRLSIININEVSTVCCVSASGTSLPPMFVVPAEGDTSDQVVCNNVHYFVYNVNDKSRNSDFYFKWFSEVLLRYAPQIRPLILLLDPDSSFITPEFISLANQNQVILLCLPPLSSHFTQPLNTTIYPALEKGFKSVKNTFLHSVCCCNFPQCFKLAWNSSVNADIIKSGFDSTGIYPLNSNVFDHFSLPAV